MEFFIIADVATNTQSLQEALVLDRIESFCESIVLLRQDEATAAVGTSWGEFELSRQPIMGGVRLALTNCPNALAWTITTGYPPEPDKVVIHLTINRREKPDDFIQSVIDFGNEWREGLEASFFTQKR